MQGYTLPSKRHSLILQKNDILYVQNTFNMNEVFAYIHNTSDLLANTYNLDLFIFFVVYIASFLPFYFGYFLILYGATRNLVWRDIFQFKFKGNIRWGKQARFGLYIHIFGRIMPYAYILIWGKNLSILFYVALCLVIILTVYTFYMSIGSYGRKKKSSNLTLIVRRDVINDSTEVETLWTIYDQTFAPINKISPCKQSLDREHFIDTLQDQTVRKYVLTSLEGRIIGIGFITNNFKNTPWISEDYFIANYPEKFRTQMVYYFMGLAIDYAYRGNRSSISLIEYIIDDLPPDAIMGFDHSRNVNPMLHHFTRIVHQAHLIERTHIDRQHYHVVERKK